MPRRELLTSTQRDELLAFPTDEADLLRYYTFNTLDLAVIRRRRGDHNRLGFAVHLCYVRFPGQLLAVGEPPDAPILAMAAAQLKSRRASGVSMQSAIKRDANTCWNCRSNSGIRPSRWPITADSRSSSRH